jgi:hypothetical protein
MNHQCRIDNLLPRVYISTMNEYISLFYSYYYVKVKGLNLLEGLKRDYVVYARG